MMWFDPQEKKRARSEWRINNRKGINFSTRIPGAH
jgi:hypothetical protein